MNFDQQLSHRVSFNGMRPLALTKRQVVSVLGSSKLVARMLWASRHVGDKWLVVVRSGRDLLIDTESVEVAYERLLRGEQPPLMLCERRRASAGNGPARAIRPEAARKRKPARVDAVLAESRGRVPSSPRLGPSALSITDFSTPTTPSIGNSSAEN